MTFAPEASAVPTRSSPGAGGASVRWRSDITSEGHQPRRSRLRAPACHDYGDALSPNSEWPCQLPTPKTPTAILRYAVMMVGLGPRGIRCFSNIVFRLVPALPGSVPAASNSSLTGYMDPTWTVDKLTYMHWPFLTPSSRVRLDRMVLGLFGASQAPGHTLNLLHRLPCTRC